MDQILVKLKSAAIIGRSKGSRDCNRGTRRDIMKSFILTFGVRGGQV